MEKNMCQHRNDLFNLYNTKKKNGGKTIHNCLFACFCRWNRNEINFMKDFLLSLWLIFHQKKIKYWVKKRTQYVFFIYIPLDFSSKYFRIKLISLLFCNEKFCLSSHVTIFSSEKNCIFCVDFMVISISNWFILCLDKGQIFQFDII